MLFLSKQEATRGSRAAGCQPCKENATAALGGATAAIVVAIESTIAAIVRATYALANATAAIVP